MNEIRFYVLSICALKRCGADVELAHGTGLILSGSEAEAHRKGLAGAHAQWSEAEGWTGHDVSVREVSRKVLGDIVRQLDAHVSESAQESTIVM